jgi:hypothetical protein
MVDLLGLLEAQSPKSKYLDQGYDAYLAALHQVGKDDAVAGIADKAIVNFPNNPDLLLVVANTAQVKKQADRAIQFANRLVAAANSRQKPEALPAADWERKKSIWLGRGYWISGVLNGEKNLYALSNKSLRAGLPYIKGEPGLMGPALFYLGLDNYQLGKMTNNKKQVLEGATFSEQCAAIAGPFQDQAYRNSMAMKADANNMR